MYRLILEEIRALQQAYLSGDSDRIRSAHGKLVRRGIELSLLSAAGFRDSGSLTAAWSETGTEAALAFLKAEELAEEFDSEESAVTTLGRKFLLLLGALEFYRCGRHGAAAAVLRRKEAGMPESLPKSSVVLFSQLIASLCGGNVRSLREVSHTCLTIARDRLIAESASPDIHVSMYADLALTSVANAMIALTDHLLTGEARPLDNANTWLGDATALSNQSGDSELGILSEAMGRTFESLRKLSIWTAVREVWPAGEIPPVVLNWVRHRIANSKAFLFPTQYEAIVVKRVMATNHALISMPTGGGKSLLAEFAAIRALSVDEDSIVIVVVPSRALAAEKRDELALALGWAGSGIEVCQLTGDVALDTEDAVKSHRVLVMTPEKFDILLRSDFFGARVGLLVVDEFQMLRSQHRGIKLQLAISRFRRRRETPTLFISAAVRGSDLRSLARWALSSDPFSTDWRPTPYRIGTVALDNQPWRVEFNDGTSRSITTDQHVRRNAKNKASVEVVRNFLERDQVLHFNLYWRGYAPDDNALIDLAQMYEARLPSMPHLDENAKVELTRRISRILGRSHPVSLAFSRGIAVHWGELPVVARRIVEEGVRRKAIGLIIATSTLAEGVNLPIKTVFISKLGTRHGPMEVGQFLNVAGRAGRPYFHSEGELVIGTSETGPPATRTGRAEATRYSSATRQEVERLVTPAVVVTEEFERAVANGFLSQESARPSPSFAPRLAVLQSRVNTFGPIDAFAEVPALLSDIEVLSSSILALLVEGLIDRIVGCRPLEDVLFIGPESRNDRAGVRRLLRVVDRRLHDFGITTHSAGGFSVTQWGRVVYQSGLGPESCTSLRDRLSSMNPNTEVEMNQLHASAVRHDFISEAVQLLRIPREAFSLLGRLPPDFPGVLSDWIGGVTLSQMSLRHPAFHGDYLASFTMMDRVSLFAAWVYYSCQLIVQTLWGECSLSRTFLSIAKASLYGHYDSRVQELLRRDVRREVLRDDAIALFRSTTAAEFGSILAGRTDVSRIRTILEGSRRKTRLPEDEVATAIGRIVLRAG